MRIERTEDVGFVAGILKYPGVSDFVGDDTPGDIVLPLHPEIYYLLPKIEIGVEPGMIEDRAIGALAFMPINFITWNPHIAILPEYRGMGTEAMELGIAWMFENTRCKKIVAYPPEYNKAMLRVFEKCGFRLEGYSPKSVLKNGTLHGRHLMGRGR